MGLENHIIDRITQMFPVRVAAAVFCLLFLLGQSLTLDYYLVAKKGDLWWLWTVADAIVVGVFIAAFVASFKLLNNHDVIEADGGDVPDGPPTKEGELPLGYVAWLVYSLPTAVKIGIIFEDVAGDLDEKNFFGPNTLKISVVLTGVVFLLLVATHNNAKPGTTRSAFITSLNHGVLFNIFDTVTILELLIVEQSHILLPFDLHRAINAIGCINIIVPFIPLLVLSRTRYGRDQVTTKVHAVHAFVYLICINLPLFIIRMYLWHALDKDISVFLMKNVLGICFAIADIWRSCLKPADDGKSKDSTEGIELHVRHNDNHDSGGADERAVWTEGKSW